MNARFLHSLEKEKVDGKYMISEIVLSPVLTIKSDAEKEKALKLLEKSEAACLISNSVKSTIIFNPTINIQEPWRNFYKYEIFSFRFFTINPICETESYLRPNG